MNSDFLKKEFSNKLFVAIFKEFLDQMDQQFDRENQERIDRLAVGLTASWIDKSIVIAKQEKKMPWMLHYKEKLKILAVELLKTYQENTKP